jgi:hypothetical protein
VDPQAAQATEQRGSLRSLLVSCALLAAVLTPLAVVIAWFAFSRNHWTGVAAAAIAGGVCWLSASLALAAVYLGQQLNNPIAGIMSSMFFRMGLPLAVGLAINQWHAPLSQAGCFLMILGLYLVALVIETILSLQFVPPTTHRASSEATAVSGRAAAGGIPGQ